MEQHGEYSIKNYSPEHKSDIVKLSKVLWPESENKREKYFVWKHLKNPNIEKPCVYVSIYKDKVVGFRCFFGARYSFHDDTFLISSPCDSMVDSSHRRKGLFSLMTKYGIKDILRRNIFRFHLSLSSNRFSLPGYLKLGWMPVAPRNVMFFPTVSLITDNFFNHKESIIQRKLDAIDPILKKIFILEPDTQNDFEISDVVLADEMEKLANRNFQKEKLGGVRNKLFYDWRFKNPIKNFIFAYSRNKNLDLTAYAVLGKFKNNNYKLIEYQYDNYDDLQILLCNLVKRLPFRKLSTQIFNKDVSVIKILNKVGFQNFSLLSRIRDLSLPFLVRPITISPIESDWYIGDKDIRDENIWNLAQIDSDA